VYLLRINRVNKLEFNEILLPELEEQARVRVIEKNAYIWKNKLYAREWLIFYVKYTSDFFHPHNVPFLIALLLAVCDLERERAKERSRPNGPCVLLTQLTERESFIRQHTAIAMLQN
jgi:hypothetical protein